MILSFLCLRNIKNQNVICKKTCRIEFVEKWEESLKQASYHGHVDWPSFKKVSRPWIDDAIGQNNNYINTSMNNAAQNYQL